MQQLLDTAKMDQEGAASLAVDWAADADCVDPVLGTRPRAALPIAPPPPMGRSSVVEVAPAS